MTKIRTLQIYRGTTAQNNAYTGSAGELTMDTTTNELRLHDGSTVGGHIIGSGGGSSSGYHPDLFDCKWADHICNDVQWLRADTFSWQSGAVYQAAYQHLTADITGKTLQSETIGSTTIQFYLADDGHKICPASEESNVTAIYNATSVAWYYILDTANTRFKLPRTQFGFTGYRDAVGKYVEAGLPNIIGDFEANAFFSSATGAMSLKQAPHSENGGGGSTATGGVELDVSKYNSIYGNSDTVQPKATEMYLYFYVGNFTQTALENTAGLNAELFNGKADLNLSNTASNIDFVVENQEPTAQNNYTWYRKYKSGWVEQGGKITNSGDSVYSTITLPIEMANTEYTVQVSQQGNSTNSPNTTFVGYKNISTTQVLIGNRGYGGEYARTQSWQVSGMAAQ